MLEKYSNWPSVICQWFNRIRWLNAFLKVYSSQEGKAILLESKYIFVLAKFICLQSVSLLAPSGQTQRPFFSCVSYRVYPDAYNNNSRKHDREIPDYYPFVTPPEQSQPIPSCVEIPFLKWSQTQPQFTCVEKGYFFFLDEKGGSASFMFTCLSTVATQTAVSTYEVKPHMFLSEQRPFANLYFSRWLF